MDLSSVARSNANEDSGDRSSGAPATAAKHNEANGEEQWPTDNEQDHRVAETINIIGRWGVTAKHTSP